MTLRNRGGDGVHRQPSDPGIRWQAAIQQDPASTPIDAAVQATGKVASIDETRRHKVAHERVDVGCNVPIAIYVSPASSLQNMGWFILPASLCRTDFPGGLLEPPNWQVFLVTPSAGKPPDVSFCLGFHWNRPDVATLKF